MMIIDMLPFSTVENKSFRSLLSTIEPLYTIPSRKSNITPIEKMYTDKSHTIKNIIENIKYSSLTTDGWTSTAIDSYLTFTAHYSDNWKL